MRNLEFSKNLNKRAGKNLYIIYEINHEVDNFPIWLGRIYWNKISLSWKLEIEKKIVFDKQEIKEIIDFMEKLS